MYHRAFIVTLEYACFAIFSNSLEVVVEAAPIARWMIGKTLAEIKPWLLEKRAKVLEVTKQVEIQLEKKASINQDQDIEIAKAKRVE